ncbi:MAG: hypothetical protein R2711_08015 [Acidimicrobiales bacterium]
MSYDDRPFDAEADAPVDDEEPTRRRSLVRGRQVDAEDLLRRVSDLIAAARPRPLSASAMINKEEVLELLDEAIARLPDELREARWLRKEREEYLAKMRADGEEITEAARAFAEQMVQRTEVVKAAEHRARRIVESAEAEESGGCGSSARTSATSASPASRSCSSGPSSSSPRGATSQATNLPRPDDEEEAEPDPADGRSSTRTGRERPHQRRRQAARSCLVSVVEVRRRPGFRAGRSGQRLRSPRARPARRPGPRGAPRSRSRASRGRSTTGSC